jgi:F-type H+-transporting ATPase subunit b
MRFLTMLNPVGRYPARTFGAAGAGLAVFVSAALPALAEEESKGGMPQLDPSSFAPQLVWLTITFIVLYLLMSRLLLPRIGSVLETRRSQIAGDLTQAERLKLEAETAIADYEAAHAKAQAEAQKLASSTRERLNAESARRRGELDAALGQEAKTAEAAIQQAKQAALGNIRAVAAEVAQNMVKRLLAVDVAPAAAEAAVDAVANGKAS